MFKIEHDAEEHFFCSYTHDLEMESMGFPQHYHNMFEIYFMERGSCRYFIDNKSYNVSDGDIVIIPGGIIHKTWYDDNKYLRFLISCSKYFVPSGVSAELSKIIYVYHNDEILPVVKEIFKAIQADYEHPDKFSGDAIRNLMHLLFVLLARNSNQKSHAEIKNIYIDTAIDYIKKNYGSYISLEMIAERCSVSSEHMSRLFKKETGYGFSEYLTVVRMQNAEYLLKNSNSSITDVAQKCGFVDSNYFSTVFKKIYGITPSEVKKQSAISKKPR